MSDATELAQKLVGAQYLYACHLCQGKYVRFRVARKDGRAMVLTRDYIPERLNFTIEDEQVVSVTMG